MKTRQTARMVLMDPKDRVLLMKIQDNKVTDLGRPKTRSFWVTPGGKLEPGELPRQTVARELEEEMGIRDAVVGNRVWRGEVDLLWHGEPTRLTEDFFLTRTATTHLEHSAMSADEKRVLKDCRWFSLSDLQRCPDMLIPQRMAELVEELLLLKGEVKDKAIDLSTPQDGD